MLKKLQIYSLLGHLSLFFIYLFSLGKEYLLWTGIMFFVHILYFYFCALLIFIFQGKNFLFSVLAIFRVSLFFGTFFWLTHFIQNSKNALIIIVPHFLVTFFIQTFFHVFFKKNKIFIKKSL